MHTSKHVRHRPHQEASTAILCDSPDLGFDAFASKYLIRDPAGSARVTDLCERYSDSRGGPNGGLPMLTPTKLAKAIQKLWPEVEQVDGVPGSPFRHFRGLRVRGAKR